jgi:hypothetical protein
MSVRARNAAMLAGLFAVLVAFYAATFSFRAITDTRLNSLQTRALVEHGSVDLSGYPGHEDFLRPDLTARQIVPREGGVYSIYGIGISVVAAPVYAPLVRLDASEAFMQGAVGILFVAGAVLVVYRLLGSVAPPAIAAGATAVFAIGTTMWTVASMAFFPQGPVVFFECVGLAGLFSRKTWGPALAGFGLATATFIRPTMAIPLAIVGGFYLLEDRRAAARFAIGAATPLIAIMIQNRLIWDGWLAGGYSKHGVGFNAPWPSSLYRILFGLWRGLFVYSPALLLAVPGVAIAARRLTGYVERRLLVIGASAFATIIVTSRWSAWHGGVNQFGYRLLLEVVPFLVVLGAYAVTRLERLRPVAILLGVLSILTTTWGAAPSPNGWDGKLFASDIADTSLGQAWIVFFDHPLDGIFRLAGVAALCALMFVLARRMAPDRPAFVGEA